MSPLARCLDTAAKFLIGKPALVEKLGEQRVVGLSNEFDQFTVELGDTILPLAGCRLLAKSAPAGSLVGDNITAEHVENLIKARSGIHWHIHREYPRTILRARIGKYVIKICVFLVHRIDNDDLRDPAFGGVIPNPFSTYAETVLRMNDNQREVGDPQGGQRLAHAIHA